MNKIPASKKAAVIFLLAAAATSMCLAVETRTWEQSDQSDFARGTRKGLSIRSDGRVTLAPEFKELDSTGVPYLWTLAQDSKGTLYYAGGAPTGATTKVFALARNGKPRVFAEVTGLEVHAWRLTGKTVYMQRCCPTPRSTDSTATESRSFFSIRSASTFGRWCSTSLATCWLRRATTA